MYGYYTERDYKGDFPYTDLAAERRRADVELAGVEYRKESGIIGSWERIKITTKKRGRIDRTAYRTLRHAEYRKNGFVR